MNKSPLLSCRIKLDRSKKHRQDLETVIDAFAKRQPYQIITDRDSEPAIRVDRLHIIEYVPVDFSGYIGDAIHNLRSALDALAISLAQRDASWTLITESALRDIAFPIHGTAEGFANGLAELPFNDSTKELLSELQPFRSGAGDAFWALNRLDIFDKHRSIIPAVGGLMGVRYQAETQDIMNLTGKFPLKEGDELARHSFNEVEYHAHAHFTFEVAFGEGQPLTGKGVLVMLDEFINLVESTVDIFATNVFKTRW